jgi:hypothetical protein
MYLEALFTLLVAVVVLAVELIEPLVALVWVALVAEALVAVIELLLLAEQTLVAAVVEPKVQVKMEALVLLYLSFVVKLHQFQWV